jgi:ParB-like chromosome segregation protein Spo0J
MNLNNSISVELREITLIRPYERNPRLNDKAVDAVAGSLREFGFRQPIVVDSDGVIIAGHTRYKAEGVVLRWRSTSFIATLS